jgi:hypothetical protein
MTVIACSLREMAADRLCVVESRHYFAIKIFRLDDGTVVGGAGTGAEPVIEWLRRGTPRTDSPTLPADKDDSDFHVLHLRHDGIWLYTNSLYPDKLEEKNYAVGSGGRIAQFAMRDLRKSPAEACRIAIKHDLFCGGEVDVLRLVKPKR